MADDPKILQAQYVPEDTGGIHLVIQVQFPGEEPKTLVILDTAEVLSVIGEAGAIVVGSEYIISPEEALKQACMENAHVYDSLHQLTH